MSCRYFYLAKKLLQDLGAKIGDKWNKKEIKQKNLKKSTEIEKAISLQKNKYYNIITITFIKNSKNTEEGKTC